MPVSEDEFERPVQMGSTQSALSKAEQRKSNKPIMEKRRRARINHCLNELKTLILDAMKKDPARHSKLEKADILEMTVKHLQQIQRQQLANAVATDPAVIMRFKSGFDECAAEVSRYIGRLEGVDQGVKQRLTAHLHRCVSSLQQISALPHQNMFSALTQNCDKNTIVLPTINEIVPSLPGDVNNNSNQNAERIQIPSGLHLIPSRLPTGELALLVPNSNHISSFFNGPGGTTFQFAHSATVNMNSVLSPTLGGSLNTNANHGSAFTAVSKNQEYPSPTSTADIIKKEPNVPEKVEFKPATFSNISGLNESYIQNYSMKNSKINIKVEDEKVSEEVNLKKINLLPISHDVSDSTTQKYGKFKTFGHISSDGIGYDQKITQRASSSSFQRNVADSTTSSLQPKDSETPETCFKPFQVEIPNSHLKAHITISESFEDVKPNIHQKPNPNFTLNPNKFYQKSPQKFAKSYSSNPESNFSELGKYEIGFEKFSKIEPLSIVTNGERIQEGNDESSLSNESSAPLMRPMSEVFQNVEGTISKITSNSIQRGVKRPLSNDSAEVSSLTSAEIPSKISINITDQSKNEQNFNQCKRISVIVEDSSKSNSNNDVSSQRDMWRPW